MSETEKKRPGPKRKFERVKSYELGAPRLATRVDPDVLEWVQSQEEGVRPYIERIVRKDKAEVLEAGGEIPEKNPYP